MCKFHSRVYLTVIVVTAIGRSVTADDAADTIDESLLAKLQGEWRPVSSVFDGKPFTSPMGEWTAVVAGRRMFLRLGDKGVGHVEIKHLDAEGGVGHLDCEKVEPDGFTVRTKQLFRLDGDTLTTCVRSPPGERPNELTRKPGSGHLLTVSQRTKGEVTKGDKEHLQGLWQAVSLEANGKKAPPEAVKEFQIRFTGDKVVFLPDNRKHTYRIDAKVKPKAMDINVGDGPQKGKRSPYAIYSLASDKLNICIDKEGKTGKRPTEFKTKAGDGLALIKLERVKPTK